MDAFSRQKKIREIGDARVAYREEGSGDPLLLLHGCPFSSFVWRKIIPQLSPDFRCLAPDLLGLGDTETPPGADWSIPAQAEMLLGFLDDLGVKRAHVVGHDQGGAIAQLLAAHNSERVDRLVLSNAQAYDNWPSRDELPLLRLTQLPFLGRVTAWLASKRPVAWLTLVLGGGVVNRRVLNTELLSGYIRASLGDKQRRARWRRYMGLQLDQANVRQTCELVDGLRRFDHPTLLLWGEDDPHYGLTWARRLEEDIAGATRLITLPRTGHLLMEERPREVADAVRAFLSAETVV